jgi:hypothetical protein
MNGACIDHMKEVTPHVCHRSRCGVRGASACTEVTDPDSDHSMWRHSRRHSLSSCIEALAGISTAERRLQGVLALIHQAGSVARRCSCRCRRTTSGSKPSDVGGGNPPILVVRLPDGIEGPASRINANELLEEITRIVSIPESNQDYWLPNELRDGYQPRHIPITTSSASAPPQRNATYLRAPAVDQRVSVHEYASFQYSLYH